VDPVAAGHVVGAQSVVLGGGAAATIGWMRFPPPRQWEHSDARPSDQFRPNRLMLVGISFDRGGATVSSVAYNGATADATSPNAENTSGSIKPRLEIWSMLNARGQFQCRRHFQRRVREWLGGGCDDLHQCEPSCAVRCSGEWLRPLDLAECPPPPQSAARSCLTRSRWRIVRRSRPGRGKRCVGTSSPASAAPAALAPGAASVLMSWTKRPMSLGAGSRAIIRQPRRHRFHTFNQTPAFCRISSCRGWRRGHHQFSST